MGSVNKVILVGNLGADPDLKYTGKGKPVCHLSLATNTSWKDNDGNRQQRTNWHKVIAWGKQGELCKQYLRKGGKVYIEGRLNRRAYEDKAGQTRYATEVVSNSVVFLDRRGDVSFSGVEQSQPAVQSASPQQAPDDDIPF